jgi:hypothetical protein
MLMMNPAMIRKLLFDFIVFHLRAGVRVKIFL